jgi:hypothetical protein
MSDASAGAQARRESYFASLLISEARDRVDAAKHRSVNALNEPSNKDGLRVRPNERYLANTLRQVNSTNARADSGSSAREVNEDNQKGGARKKRQRRRGREREEKTRTRRRKRRVRVGDNNRTDSATSSPSSEEAWRLRGKESNTEIVRASAVDEDDARLVAFLAKPGRERRGRGAVGPRSVEPGPYRGCGDAEEDGRVRNAPATQPLNPGRAPARISLGELQRKKLSIPCGVHNRFVTSTLVNTVQSNRYAASNNMWRAREKQLELELRDGAVRGGCASKDERSDERSPKDFQAKTEEL